MNLSNLIIIFEIVFLTGIISVLVSRYNVVTILMSIELVLLSINLNYLVNSTQIDEIFGSIISLFILTVAAAESSIGLAILLRYYRVRGTVSTEFIKNLKG